MCNLQNWYRVKYLWVDGKESSNGILTLALFSKFTDAQRYAKQLVNEFSLVDRLFIYIETNEKTVYLYDYQNGKLSEKHL